MAAVTSLVFNIFLCVLLGVILATQELPLAIILAGLGAWVLLLVKWFVNRQRAETITSKGEWIGLVCLVLVLVGAHLAPVKTYTTVLDMPVSLPRQSVSLGELDGPQSQSVTNLRFVLVDIDRPIRRLI
ncbi:MAG: hypothetical protein CMJ58_22155 [Planctomycetaceae bacterium]|nr:hypothetical protein [Planctomycetaceae bacterium]